MEFILKIFMIYKSIIVLWVKKPLTGTRKKYITYVLRGKYGFYLSIFPLTSLKRRSDFPVAIRCLMVHKISDFFRYIVSSFMFVHCKRSFFLGWKLSLHRCHRQLLVNPHQLTIDHQKLPQHFPLHCTQQFHRLIRKSVVFYNYIFIINR